MGRSSNSHLLFSKLQKLVEQVKTSPKETHEVSFVQENDITWVILLKISLSISMSVVGVSLIIMATMPRTNAEVARAAVRAMPILMLYKAVVSLWLGGCMVSKLGEKIFCYYSNKIFQQLTQNP